jgi:hypothetical protein
MGRIFGIVLFCVSLYVGLELYVEGTRNAFGGIFASGASEAQQDPRTNPQRAGDAVERARAEGRERLEGALQD